MGMGRGGAGIQRRGRMAGGAADGGAWCSPRAGLAAAPASPATASAAAVSTSPPAASAAATVPRLEA
eukprot:6649761-Prymnesium_polylepis.1